MVMIVFCNDQRSSLTGSFSLAFIRSKLTLPSLSWGERERREVVIKGERNKERERMKDCEGMKEGERLCHTVLVFSGCFRERERERERERVVQRKKSTVDSLSLSLPPFLTFFLMFILCECSIAVGGCH